MKIHVREVKYKKTCQACRSKTSPRSLVVIFLQNHRFLNFHLQCYSASYPHKIKKTDIKKSILPEHLKDDLKVWRKSHNLQLDVKSTPTVEKSLNFNILQSQRLWIEILKFIDPMEVHFTFLSKFFYELSWNQQLWKHFFLLRYSQQEKVHPTWKQSYIFWITKSCIGCKKLKKFISAFHSRRVCEQCSKLARFQRINSQEIKEQFGTSYENLNIKLDRGLIYYYQITEPLKKFRGENKRKFLEQAERFGVGQKCLEVIKQIPLLKENELYRKWSKSYRKPESVLDGYTCYRSAENYVITGKGALFNKIREIKNFCKHYFIQLNNK